MTADTNNNNSRGRLPGNVFAYKLNCIIISVAYCISVYREFNNL